MGRRGPISFAAKPDAADWQREWLWFFSGLRNGFAADADYEWVIPSPPRLQTHPILLDELRKKEMLVTRVERSRGSSPPDPKTWLKLLGARTIRDIRKACRGSRYWVPLNGSGQHLRIHYFLTLLCDSLGPVLLAAKQESRYPKSERPTSDERRCRFLACAMAGACLGISPRYANEML